MNDSTSSSTKAGLPLVAIIGRPNVGKSTLFNRFIGRRKAITDSTPGVTRDPVEQIWDLGERSVRLIDTGGLKVEQEGLDQLVTERSLEVAQKCDLILLILELRELNAEDEIFIEALRPFSEKIILVINKVDNPDREQEIWNFHSFGFESVIPVSAAHGRGIAELKTVITDRLPEKTDHDDTPPDECIRLAILGKPNTGKSTLSNLLTTSKNSIISDIPGTTRDVVESRFLYKGREFQVLDTAGIRRKKKVEDNVEYYSVNRAISSIADSDVVLLMVDSSEGLADQDKKIAAQIVKRGKGVVIVMNKWDLLPKVANQKQAVEDRVRFLFPALDFAPMVSLSALKGEGVDSLMQSILTVYKQLQTRVETPALNKALKEWTESNPPSYNRGKPFKVRYLTQVSAAPVIFLLFVNRSNGAPGNYIQYIKNSIRNDFQLGSIPIRMDVKQG